ncbi:MAG: chemotaxis protein CheW [Gloeomargarita sp. DG02_4_bins_56]
MSVKAPPVKYVVFRLGGAVRLAVPQMVVREGLDMATVVVAPMPGAAPIFTGIANVRGNFLWVLDLAKLLRQLEPDLALPVIPHREGLILQGGQRSLVVTIQGRDGFLSLTEADIHPLPHLRHKHLFPGMVRWEGQPVALLDPTALFQVLRQSSVR